MQQNSWPYLPFIRLFMAALLLMASGGGKGVPKCGVVSWEVGGTTSAQQKWDGCAHGNLNFTHNICNTNKVDLKWKGKHKGR